MSVKIPSEHYCEHYISHWAFLINFVLCLCLHVCMLFYHFQSCAVFLRYLNSFQFFTTYKQRSFGISLDTLTPRRCRNPRWGPRWVLAFWISDEVRVSNISWWTLLLNCSIGYPGWSKRLGQQLTFRQVVLCHVGASLFIGALVGPSCIFNCWLRWCQFSLQAQAPGVAFWIEVISNRSSIGVLEMVPNVNVPYAVRNVKGSGVTCHVVFGRIFLRSPH